MGGVISAAIKINGHIDRGSIGDQTASKRGGETVNGESEKILSGRDFPLAIVIPSGGSRRFGNRVGTTGEIVAVDSDGNRGTKDDGGW